MPFTQIAEGISKVLAYKKETTWGELPTNTGAQIIRRVTGTFNLSKETYQSDEIRTDYQMADYRHGIRSVEGNISGELSPGTYADFFAAALARDFTVGVASVGVNVTASASAPHFTRGTGSWLSDGYKVGDVVRFSNFVATGNNDNNFLITALTATDMTGIFLNGDAVTAEVGTANDIEVVGSKTFVPLTGHTDDSFTWEEYYGDIDDSEVYTGNKVNTLGLSLPATGLTTIEVGFMGKDLAQSGAGQFFSSPAAQGTNGIFAAVNGALIVQGTVVGYVTGLSININRNLSMEAVVGSNVHPDIFEGRILVDGEFTAFYTDGVYRDYFADESEVSLTVALTTSNLKNADFMSITLPRIKVYGADKNDGESGVVRTFPFQALLNFNGGSGTNSEATTMSVQDSTVV